MKSLLNKSLLTIISLVAILTQSSGLTAEETKRVRYQTIERQDIGYSIQLPNEWGLWEDEVTEYGFLSVYIGAYGEDLAGAFIGVFPELVDGLTFETLVEETLADEDAEIEFAEMVTINGYEMLHVRACERDEDEDFHLEIDAYLLQANGRIYVITYLATEAIYSKISKSFDHSIHSFKAL